MRPLISERYFLRWLHSSWCFDWLTRASGASAQQHLYIKDSRRMPVPIPPLLEQKEIVHRVDSFFKIANRIEEQYNNINDQLGKLNYSILSKAFRGELVPQNLKDQPAIELFNRIKTNQNVFPSECSNIKTSKRG
jgi:type I restriction enzyme, S subunit